MTLQWLQDSKNQYSYARVIGAICIIANLIWRLYMGVNDINSWPSAFVGCVGCITGIFLWLLEIFRENKQVSVQIGGKQYGAKIGDDNGSK